MPTEPVYNVDEEWLRQKYTVEKLTDAQIAKLVGCSRLVIQRRRTQYGIPTNPVWNKGIPASEETRRKISRARKGHPGYWRGRQFSKEHRRNLSGAQEGRVVSEETRRKISAALMGHSVSEKTIRKMKEALRGRACWNTGKRGVYSDEMLKRMSESQKQAWARGCYADCNFNPPGVMYASINMKSTWEARLAQAFDKLGWEWQYEPCCFQYALIDGEHTYTPDFYVPQVGCYFDPHWRRIKEGDKFAAVREQCGINLIVLNEVLLAMYEEAAQCV